MFFEDIELGDEIGPLEKVAADEDVIDFCNLWGPPTPNRFTDADEAAKSKLSGPIVPGIMTMALMAQLFTDWSSEDSLKDLDLVFRQSVPHNKTLIIGATVTDTRQEGEEHLIDCDVVMTGQESERYVIGTATVSLPSRNSG
ncbi:MAG: MaoC family dehydratase [Chloroflexota bacterium]|nr:MaoC family dehydratase [Chloroflexota bacterium]